MTNDGFWDDVVFEHELADSYVLNLEDMLAMLFRYSRETQDRNVLITDIKRAARAGRYTQTPESLLVAFITVTDIAALPTISALSDAFRDFAGKTKKEQVEAEMEAIIIEKGYIPASTRHFIADCLRVGSVVNGPGLNGILPVMSPLNPAYAPRKAEAFQIMTALFAKFSAIASAEQSLS